MGLPQGHTPLESSLQGSMLRKQKVLRSAQQSGAEVYQSRHTSPQPSKVLMVRATRDRPAGHPSGLVTTQSPSAPPGRPLRKCGGPRCFGRVKRVVIKRIWMGNACVDGKHLGWQLLLCCSREDSLQQDWLLSFSSLIFLMTEKCASLQRFI